MKWAVLGLCLLGCGGFERVIDSQDDSTDMASNDLAGSVSSDLAGSDLSEQADGGGMCEFSMRDYVFKREGTVEGMCTGCACDNPQHIHGWSLMGCHDETNMFGAEWVELLWQENQDFQQYIVTKTGKVYVNAKGANDTVQPTATVNAFSLLVGGKIDISMSVITQHEEPFTGFVAWINEARVIEKCK